MPLPSRSTSADPPVVLDTALLPSSSLPPAAKETRSHCLCPDGCAPRGNVRCIAATLAAGTILQTGSASTDILLRSLSRSATTRIRVKWLRKAESGRSLFVQLKTKQSYIVIGLFTKNEKGKLTRWRQAK